jgi:hypothetical protein
LDLLDSVAIPPRALVPVVVEVIWLLTVALSIVSCVLLEAPVAPVPAVRVPALTVTVP